MQISSLFRRTGLMLPIASLVLIQAHAQAPAVAAAPVTVKVMTRNMDAGTDLKMVLGAADAASFAAGVHATYKEVKECGIPQRAAQLAVEIAAQKPDLVGLQEATLWRTGLLSPAPLGASTVMYDQLGLLLSELTARKVAYDVVVVETLNDMEVPVPAENLNLRMTDRDAILVRSDFKPSEFAVHNIQTQRFSTLLTLPVLGGVTVLRSWEAADISMPGASFRFVNTHLESTIPGVSETTLLQLAQTEELLKFVPSDRPVVLLGDFNSNAEPGPENTGAVEMITKAGFLDAWKTVKPHDPGWTWPLFAEDLQPFVPANERIDLIFSRGFTAVEVQRLGFGGFQGAYASDHAGVTATLQLAH